MSVGGGPVSLASLVDEIMRARPYLREISLKRDEITNYEEYPFNIPAIKELHRLEFHPGVTFFIGENGTGKSTIVEAIALVMGFGPEGGTRNVQFSTTDTVSRLHKYLKACETEDPLK